MNAQPGKNDKTAVLLVDFQEDFTVEKKGSLAVAGTDVTYIETVIQATQAFSEKGIPVYATQDWHPENHMCFGVNNPGATLFEPIEIDGRSQIMWPAHCIQGTDGANIMMGNDRFEAVVQKGMDPKFDSYSGFTDDGGEKTGLDNQLKQAGITDLFVYGLATDVCVKFTVLDAITAGYRVHLLCDLCRGLTPEGITAAIEEMREKGTIITDTAAIMADF
ncbi:MAG: bifunctional nicotinamidase/pyrazinamidase [Thermodesulfobacteriota bacterium]